jgi:NhaP-type Na+/H+ or K+/H+ antiporter
MNAAASSQDFPCPPSSQIEAQTTPSRRLSSPAALFAVAALLGLTAGLVIGLGVGYAAGASAQSDCSASDGWCSLGAALVGLFVGTAAGVIAYVAAGVATVLHFRPSGRRARHVVAHLALPFAAVAVLSALQAVLELTR